jgi:hypothetical protein
MSHIEILQIVQTWHNMQKELKDIQKESSPNYNNSYYAIKIAEDINNYVESNINAINNWLYEYKNNNLFELWLHYGINSALNSLQNKNQYFTHYRYRWLYKSYSDINELSYYWPIFFEKDNRLNISYANSILEKYNKEKSSISYCKDQTILDIHKDKPCTNNGWYCDLCEEMEAKWLYKLDNELKKINNIFIHSELRKEFVTESKNINKQISWEPPTYYNVFYKGYKSYPIYSPEDCILANISIRKNDKKIGQTASQYLKTFISNLIQWDYSLTIDNYNENAMNDLFARLWSLKSVVKELIHINREYIQEFKNYYNIDIKTVQ